MQLVFTARFDRSLREAPDAVQRAFWKQAQFLLRDMQHPSLRAKKYNESNDVWQARVNREWRFYFKIIGGEYHLIDNHSTPEVEAGIFVFAGRHWLSVLSQTLL